MDKDLHFKPKVSEDVYSDFNNQKQIDRIRKLVDKWVGTLGLRWWHIRFQYQREPLQKRKDQGEEISVIAHCWADWSRMKALITFCTTETQHYDDDDLEVIFLHELGHVFVRELAENPVDGREGHEERVVTILALALKWARERGVEEGKALAKKEKKVKKPSKVKK